MKPSEAQIAERLPVWEALSEFFLDTELQPSDYERIARVLAASKYSKEEIEEILIGEVCPVCRSNALSLAGEWLGFNPSWLKEKISPFFGRHPRFKLWFVLRNSWIYARHWKTVRQRLVKLRSG
ncbi:MAG TPA: hypothetical protein VN873_09215 [Candidatus Angelobacter sp.]|nr:hypothetical protein [Candidatus Angelobacter sp.]